MIGHDMVTYIYIRPQDGKCVHSNCCGGAIGGEYKHDNPDWQPPKDWPFKIRDMRKEKAETPR